MIKLNSKLIDNPKNAREVLMAITASLYTGMNKNTPLGEAAKIAGLCTEMWHVCDALGEMERGITR